ncbi:hypothetical protein JQ629_13420 [Bradyrhizobium sp. AUGA SZCCT0222]|nr:hypothetical protein [Bradyrhizobium sp. AUGA SZCCT0222]MBR1268513.1 hypothetical protein [Bradyrhizobium sp. AUGA SZCCT0222]
MGERFTLLRFDSAADVAALEAAARLRGPLGVLDVEGADIATDDGNGLVLSGLVLSRPDQHVAWRGVRVPDDPLGLIDRARGAGS